jgi:tetratricopeptide (TPR) repeat protein
MRRRRRHRAAETIAHGASLALVGNDREDPSRLQDLAHGHRDRALRDVLEAREPALAELLAEQAQAAAEAKDVAMAQRLYRKVMRIEPNDPAAAFNLGNLLRSLGRNAEAEATYRAATRADPRFAEAWYNLADMLDDQNQPEKAISCLDRALDADPDYSDAIFNLGLLHQRQDRYAEALAYWRRYLALDTQSPWALRARRGLKYCELRLANSYPDIYRRSERGRSKESP